MADKETDGDRARKLELENRSLKDAIRGQLLEIELLLAQLGAAREANVELAKRVMVAEREARLARAETVRG